MSAFLVTFLGTQGKVAVKHNQKCTKDGSIRRMRIHALNVRPLLRRTKVAITCIALCVIIIGAGFVVVN